MDPVLFEVVRIIFGWSLDRLDEPDDWWATRLGIADLSPSRAVVILNSLLRDHFFDILRLRQGIAVAGRGCIVQRRALPHPHAQVVAFTGFGGAGKDTAADLLCAVHQFQRASFAAPLKDVVALLFGWDRELLEGRTLVSRRWREEEDPFWSRLLCKINHPFFLKGGRVVITPRKVLQFFGTDLLRTHLHRDIWVLSLQRRLEQNTCGHKVVVTDARFANEIKMLKSMGAVVLRLRRGEEPAWAETARRDPLAMIRTHPSVHVSEWAALGLEDEIVDNDSNSLVELRRGLEESLKMC